MPRARRPSKSLANCRVWRTNKNWAPSASLALGLGGEGRIVPRPRFADTTPNARAMWCVGLDQYKMRQCSKAHKMLKNCVKLRTNSLICTHLCPALTLHHPLCLCVNVLSLARSRPSFLPICLPSFLPLSLLFSRRDTKYQKPPNADEDPGWRILDLAFGFAAAAFPPILPVTPLTASSLASSIDVLARTPLLARADVNRDRGCDGLAGGMSSMPVCVCVFVCVCACVCSRHRDQPEHIVVEIVAFCSDLPCCGWCGSRC